MDKSTDKIKMRGGKIKKVRGFMFLSGFSGNFMDSEVSCLFITHTLKLFSTKLN